MGKEEEQSGSVCCIINSYFLNFHLEGTVQVRGGYGRTGKIRGGVGAHDVKFQKNQYKVMLMKYI